MSYDSDQRAAKQSREKAASGIAEDLSRAGRLHSDGLSSVAMVFCALTNPPAYGDLWRQEWTQVQESHQEALELLTRCTDTVVPIAVYYPKLEREVREALAGLQLLADCMRAITLLIQQSVNRSPPNANVLRDEPGKPLVGKTDSDTSKLWAHLESMSNEDLRKAIETAADISIGHAVVLLMYLLESKLASRQERLLEGLPKLSADAKGVEMVPGIYLHLGTAKLNQSRLAFAVRYLEVKGLIKKEPRPKLSKKWMDGLDSDVASVDRERIGRIIGAR